MAARSAFAAGRVFAVLAGAAGAASLRGLDLAGLDVGAERGAFGLVEFAVSVLVVLGDEFRRGTLPATTAGAAILRRLDLAGVDVGAECGAFGLVEFAVPVLVVLGDEFGRGALPATAAGAVVGVGVLRPVLRGSGDGGGGDEGEEQEALDDVFHRIR